MTRGAGKRLEATSTLCKPHALGGNSVLVLVIGSLDPDPDLDQDPKPYQIESPSVLDVPELLAGSAGDMYA